MRQFVQLALLFFVALGPLRLATALESFPGDLSDRQARGLALRAVGIATGVTLVLALLGLALRRAWDLSWGAAGVAMGLILMAGALQGLFPVRTSRVAAPDQSRLSVRSLAIPALLSPFGMAAVLLGLTWAPRPGARLDAALAAVLLGVMGLNLACLLQARRIGAWLGAPGLRVVGWAAAILLAAFAVQAIVTPVQDALLRCSLQGGDDLDDGSVDTVATLGRPPAALARPRPIARRPQAAHARIAAVRVRGVQKRRR